MTKKNIEIINEYDLNAGEIIFFSFLFSLVLMFVVGSYRTPGIEITYTISELGITFLIILLILAIINYTTVIKV